VSANGQNDAITHKRHPSLPKVLRLADCNQREFGELYRGARKYKVLGDLRHGFFALRRNRRRAARPIMGHSSLAGVND
jgi:hypothetical protein